MLAVPALGATNIIELERDAAGNITRIKRQTAAALAVTGFAPASGAPGSAVTVYGSGFSPTPLSNTVAFNGVQAVVTAAASGSLAVTVPSGATDGRISVTVGGVTATSGQDFVVLSPDAPVISSFAPPSGAAGTTVTVTGTGFATAPGATTVKLNGVAATTNVSNATSLNLTVPGATASGRITVTTAAGTGSSTSDFLVPPPGIALADVAQSARLSVGGTATNVAVGASGKHALLLFDGASDTHYTVQFGQLAVSPSSATVAYTIVKPDNTVLTTGNLGTSYRPTIHVPKLPATGTYSIIVSPGSATFNANVRAIADPVLAIDGAAAASSLNTFYQSARFVFNASASQRIGVGVLGVTSSPTGTANLGFRLYLPNGTQLTMSSLPYCLGPAAGNPQGNCEGEILTTVAGTYTLVAEAPSSNYSNFSVQLSGEAAGTLTPDVGLDISLARVGQDGRFTFAATAGDSLGLDLSGINPLPQSQAISIIVLKPDGSSLVSCSATPPAGAYCELGALAVSGTYTVVIDPAFGAYGTARLTLKQGTTLAAADPASAFSAGVASESGRFRFTGTAGQNLTIGVADLAYVSGSGTTYLAVYRPDRTQLGSSASCSPAIAAGRCKLTLANLPVSGTYSVVLLSPAGIKLSANVARSDDITGSLTAGTAQVVTAQRAGQNARFTFSGTAGESTSLKFFGVATTPAAQALNAFLYRPDGAYVGSFNVSGANTSSILNLPSLPSTGTYSVLLEPTYGITWQAQLMLDPGAMLALDGTTATLSTSVAGEPLRYRFSGTIAQRLEFGVAGLTYGVASGTPTYASIYRPDGTSIGSATCTTSGAGTCETFVASLPSTGTYSVVLLPPAASAVSGGTLFLSTPVPGTLTIGGGSQTVGIARAGQTARLSFSGTSGQLLRLNWSSTVVSGGASVSISVLKPDGTSLSASSFVNGATGGFDIASLPVTGTYTVVLDPSAAATISAPLSLVTR